MELRPRMLKDCLLEDSNSCSSNGFKSIPRRPPLNTSFPKKKKQSNALQAVINAVKNIRSNAMKSTSSGSFLPRSLSRRLSSSKNKAENQARITTIVRVKDIVRWSSSKDLQHEDRSRFQPHHQYTAKTMTTITGSSTGSDTSCSSWCDSDFTSELLPSSSWAGGNVEKEEGGENYKLQCVGEDSCTAVTDADTVVGPEDLQCEEEQKSPVSVLELQHDESSDSSFSQCLDNVERTKQKLMQTIERFENLANISPFNLDDEWDEESLKDESCDTEIEEDEVEEKAGELWDRVKERHGIWIHEEHLIMDYFRDELMQRTNETHHPHFEEQLVGEAKGWLEGQRVSELERGTGEQRRQACAREIERLEWNEKRMKEEREEVAMHVEDGLFSMLMSETLNALFE